MIEGIHSEQSKSRKKKEQTAQNGEIELGEPKEKKRNNFFGEAFFFSDVVFGHIIIIQPTFSVDSCDVDVRISTPSPSRIRNAAFG